MDEDLQRREYILNIILIGSIVMLAILDAIVLFHTIQDGASYRDIPFAVFSVLPAFFIFLYVLSRRGFSGVASYLLIATYLASDSYAAYRWGVGMQMVLIAYALIIVMATILRGTKFGFFVTGLIAAFIIPLWDAQIHGVIATQAQRLSADDAIVFSVLYFLIMIVAWLYNREIERSLRRAKNSEQALKEERDLLEIKIVERTEELRQTQLEKVQQLNRLAELGQLSSGLFHDILNLLTALSLRADADEAKDPSLASALKTTKQIEGFMQAVRKQIRGARGQELFSLVQGIEHTVQLVNYQANKEHVSIVFDHDPRTDIIHFDAPFKFQEIVINLLLNAIESYEGIPGSDSRARTITIAIAEKNGTAELSVRDNGYGMAPEVRARIFEPFFTTKSGAKGIGIGLPTIKKIIEKDMSGTIAVESKPGRGTLFTVIFPIRYETTPENDRLCDRTHKDPTIS
ncbi:MAG: ATP-binding protein [Minisyncoccia bacterium]